MRRLPALAIAAALLLGGVTAQASDAMLLADRAGFLVGHAQRCGVADPRLEHSAALVERLIVAFALDPDDRKAAEQRFGDRLLASVLAEQAGDPLPTCNAVRRQLALLERHRAPAQPGAAHVAEQSRSRGVVRTVVENSR